MLQNSADKPWSWLRASGAFAFLVSCGAAACEKRAEPAPVHGTPPGASVAAPAQPSAGPAASGKKVTWAEPKGWPVLPKQSAMRKATYVVPRAEGDSEDGELAVFYFGQSGGGSVDANMDRWIQQFSGMKKDEIKREQRSINGLLQHTIEIPRGTFASGMPGAPSAPKSDFALLGAIVETPLGNYFFKLTGPKRTVASARDKFFTFLDGVQAS
jgi:hypothetical protein